MKHKLSKEEYEHIFIIPHSIDGEEFGKMNPKEEDKLAEQINTALLKILAGYKIKKSPISFSVSFDNKRGKIITIYQ